MLETVKWITVTGVPKDSLLTQHRSRHQSLCTAAAAWRSLSWEAAGAESDNLVSSTVWKLEEDKDGLGLWSRFGQGSENWVKGIRPREANSRDCCPHAYLVGLLDASLFAVSRNPQTLDPTLVLNAGTVHRGTPLPDFPIFAPPTCFFWQFFFQNWNLQP
jgi:hypothetical protein